MVAVEIYTVKETSKLLKLSTRRVYELCKLGELESIRTGIRGGIRITRAAIDKLLGLN